MGRDEEYYPPQLSKETTVNAYFAWLCDLIHVDQGLETYRFLAESLHRKLYVWSVPNDDNRALDATDLRRRFCRDTDISYAPEYFDFDVSMLEVLVAISYRCEDIMSYLNVGMDMINWFWRLLRNVELDKFMDVDFDYHGGKHQVNQILEKIIQRTYNFDGRGGLFPLKKALTDQRDVEIWYQMNNYLIENYYEE